jgi:tRNA(adenine34) deaminase
MAIDVVILAATVHGDAAALIEALCQRGLKTIHSTPESADFSPAQCVLVGTTPEDVASARTAGLTCLAVGHDVNRLRSAGARAVYRDIAELLGGLDDALTLASPGELRLTIQAMEALMRPALGAARQALQCGEAPIGCALYRGDGTLIATGHNQQNATQNKIAHAEVMTFTAAAGKVPLDARDLILASTLEPCVMCTGAAMEAAVETILYGLRAPADAGSHRVACPTSPESQMPRIVGGILAEESRALLREFLNGNPRPQQAAFVRQLLKD